MKFRQATLTICLLFSVITLMSAQNDDKDSTIFYTLETFNKDLSRQQQLEILDHTLGEDFNLEYELKLVLQEMEARSKKYLQKYVYLKAKKPAPIIQPNEIVSNTEILIPFNSYLNRQEQLDVLDKATGKKFDLEYELKLLIQNMNDDEKEELLVYVFKKARKPLELRGKKEVAKIYWKEVEYNFGPVKKGQTVKHVFQFQNIGNVPFDVKDVHGSCGCTLGEYTDGIVQPGESGKITVSFDSTGKPSGENTELITVTGNTYPESIVLVININVY